ncbi:anti-sigma factor family protein [Thalassospira marina]|uniref:Anti-sigma factor n=1 Tax=Thalassospira marina TaxID=2048283 RepID=A0A2N3KMX5_9PROT|nr:anti-sigma factor [Thalassospira marina]PKR51894.1 hypothetical protein COO20_17320 [Thalassospira marina]
MSPHNHDDIGEDDLHGYVDGQLSAERHRQVEEWLKDNPEAARDVASWQAQNMALQDLFQPVASADDAALDAKAQRTRHTRQANSASKPHDQNGEDGRGEFAQTDDKPEFAQDFGAQHSFGDSDDHDDLDDQVDLGNNAQADHETGYPAGPNRIHGERHRPTHREDLTRNLRSSAHLGRRMPSAPSFLGDSTETGKRQGRYPLRQIAAIFMVFLAGGIGGAAIMEATLSGQPGNPDFVTALPAVSSAGYGIYASEIRHPVEVYADQKDHLVGWLGKRLGVDFSAPDLSSEGFQLVGGRLVPFEDKPGALLMYEDNSGQRLTLMVGHNPDNTSTGFRYQSAGKIETFYWIDGPVGYAVSGEISKDHLEDVALAVYRQTGG